MEELKDSKQENGSSPYDVNEPLISLYILKLEVKLDQLGDGLLGVTIVIRK